MQTAVYCILTYLILAIALFADDLKIVSKDDKFGVVDASGKIIIPVKHHYILREKEYFVVGDVSTFERISHGISKATQLDVTITLPCFHLPPGGGNCHSQKTKDPVRLKSTAAFYDLNGKKISSNRYLGKVPAFFAENRTLYLKTNNETVFVDEKGTEVLFPGGSIVGDSFANGLLTVEKWSGGFRRYGLLSLDGKIQTPIKYSTIGNFSKEANLAGVSIWAKSKFGHQLHGFININGEEVIPPKYTHASEFEDGMSRVHLGEYNKGPPTYIGHNGKELVLNGFFTKEYSGDHEYANGLLTVTDTAEPVKDSKWGYVNKQGELVIPLQFEYTQKFHENAAIVKMGGYGAIDTAGKFIIPPVYSGVEDFVSGATIAFNYTSSGSERYGLIDKTGKILAPFTYAGLSRKDSNGAPLKNRIVGTVITGKRKDSYGTHDIKKHCLLSDRGQLLIPCQYDFIRETKSGFQAIIERTDYHTDTYFFDDNGKYLKKK